MLVNSVGNTHFREFMVPWPFMSWPIKVDIMIDQKNIYGWRWPVADKNFFFSTFVFRQHGQI